jgi:taurine--2-oxoglutarate transaminase
MTVDQGATRSSEILARSREYVLHPWATQGKWEPTVFVGGEGCYLVDAEGRRYLDFSSQMTTISVGYQHPRVVEAIAAQARKLCYIAPTLGDELSGRLGELIAELTPGDLQKSFFTLGGSESNEVAIRLAREYTGRTKIVGRYHSYHGATYGALSVSGSGRAGPGIAGVVKVLWQDCYRCPFGQRYPGCGLECAQHVDQVIEMEGPDTIAALIAEPIAMGVDYPPPEYYPRLREICDRHGILLIADEIITGFGRTGQWFGCNHTGVVPDIMTTAKGMNSGYAAVGATILSRKVAEFFDDRPLGWGFTSGGQPLGFAACLAVIETIKAEGLVENARQLGAILDVELHRLQERHPSVGHVRGAGLWWFLELVRDRTARSPLTPPGTNHNVVKSGTVAERMRGAMAARGLLCHAAGNMVRVQPPLIVDERQLREGLAILDEALEIADAAAVGA